MKIIPLYIQRPPLERMHRKVFHHVLKGLLFSDLDDSAAKFLSKAMHNLLCPRIFSHVESAKKKGEKVFLLSSSPLYLVEKIAREFSFDGWAGTEYGIDKEGRICEIASLITGFEKREIASRWKGVEGKIETIAYSDSSQDLPLLEWADRVILIRPSRRLRKIARARNWTLEQ
jgi:phosphoserine phosphatase